MKRDIQQLCAEVGVSDRTLRTWIKARILPRPDPAGSQTVYGESFYLRAMAAKALRTKNQRLSHIRAQLAEQTDDALRAIAGLEPPAAELALAPAPDPAVALTPAPAPEPTPPAPAPALAPAAAPIAAAPSPPEAPRWRRIEVFPGVELHVRDDAGPFAQRIADDIAAARWPAPASLSS